MSEDEIIENCKDTVKMLNGDTHYVMATSFSRAKAIQGLLDLYQKEKENNKELEKDYFNHKRLINGLTIAAGIALGGRTIEISKKTLYELENTMKIEQIYIPETDSYKFKAI